MAWNEELARRFASRCVECGAEFAAGEPRVQLALGHAMHEVCYDRVLERMERGSLGDSGEGSQPGLVERERATFLKREVEREHERLAFERTATLFGVETAERIERLLCEQKNNNTS